MLLPPAGDYATERYRNRNLPLLCPMDDNASERNIARLKRTPIDYGHRSTFAPGARVSSLWESVAQPGQPMAGKFHARAATIALADLAAGSTLDGKLEALRGRSIVLATREQLATAIALVELDGVARRLVLCTPDLTPEQFDVVATAAEADAILVDGDLALPSNSDLARYGMLPRPTSECLIRRRTEATEWILLTSGTMGVPKLVVHSFESLAGALPRQPTSLKSIVWSTFYDIRRYGGLQIYLRAVLSGAPLVLSSAGESTHDFLARAGAAGVTHISGTPSHWRRALMSGDARLIAPEYVRLSGEVADQTVLDNLHVAYPDARIAHAFASTEAGVAFDVNDGLEGFPVGLVAGAGGAIDMKVQEGTLWIRSGRTAARYLNVPSSLGTADGYVDTGDMVELVAGRYYFRGRKGGIINVGGLKVYPEEVESVLNADPRVRMSRVMGRRNPITGAVIVAEVVLADAEPSSDSGVAEGLKSDLLNACRRTLAAHKVPALLRFVPTLELTAAGKLVRP
jgi:acyl-coenzyme A synthetase/AMP-(fatty) acid ligase